MWTKAIVVGSTVKTPNGFVDLSPWWPKFLDADTEAEIILKGVMKNKATIKHDLAWYLMWWLYSLFPRVYLWAEDITVMKQARAVALAPMADRPLTLRRLLASHRDHRANLLYGPCRSTTVACTLLPIFGCLPKNR
jgi:hypothetical protein